MRLYFLMAPDVHFHQCTPPKPLGHQQKAGFPLFTVLVKLSYLVLLEGKSSIFDQVINSVLPPPPRFTLSSCPCPTPHPRKENSTSSLTSRNILPPDLPMAVRQRFCSAELSWEWLPKGALDRVILHKACECLKESLHAKNRIRTLLQRPTG